LRIALTSGSTGSPLKVYLTNEALQFQWAVRWRHKARFGLRLGDKSLMFGPHLPVSIKQEEPPYWRHNQAINNSYIPVHILSPKTMPHVINWLNSEDFDYFTGYASAMYVLATFMVNSGKRLLNRPKYIVSGAETLLPTFRNTVKDVFGATVTDQYGMAEACGNFSQCEKGRYHQDFEFGICELLPIRGLEHTRLRKLVFTGLANQGMPFIRYDIGDYGILSEGPCKCGRLSVSLDGIDGRIADYVRTPEGRMIVGMGQVFRWTSGVNQTQIIQNKIDEIEVLIVPSNSYEWQADNELLERELRKRVGASLTINFRVVEKIPLQKNGKFRPVISNLVPISEGESALQLARREGL
jgi:phenylacetate-CoA ligase